MNKTEKRLMEMLADDGQITVEFGFTTYNKNSQFGKREANAARKLEEKGLIKIISNSRRYETNSNGTATHITTVKYGANK